MTRALNDVKNRATWLDRCSACASAVWIECEWLAYAADCVGPGMGCYGRLAGLGSAFEWNAELVIDQVRRLSRPCGVWDLGKQLRN